MFECTLATYRRQVFPSASVSLSQCSPRPVFPSANIPLVALLGQVDAKVERMNTEARVWASEMLITGEAENANARASRMLAVKSSI